MKGYYKKGVNFINKYDDGKLIYINVMNLLFGFL